MPKMMIMNTMMMIHSNNIEQQCKAFEYSDYKIAFASE
jgi:hypothetical protein